VHLSSLSLGEDKPYHRRKPVTAFHAMNSFGEPFPNRTAFACLGQFSGFSQWRPVQPHTIILTRNFDTLSAFELFHPLIELFTLSDSLFSHQMFFSFH
jgi:hypothetical protein